MTKVKSTKRALLGSALALLICVSMLIGSTFAWFTDSATTGSNIIKSGKLDVVLEMEQGEDNWVSAEGLTLDWIKAEGTDEVLWEPGCTYQLPKLRIRNAGNLALKYQVQISGFEGDKELLDVIDFTLPQQDATESLLPGDSDEFIIEGHMQETANNDYMDLQLSGISITVVATQLASESDSYGSDYDKDAFYGTLINADENDDLLNILKNAKADEDLVINLKGNIEWPTNSHNGFDNITDAASVVIDGNGKYTLTATGAGVTAIGDDNAPFMLRNLTVKDASVSYEEDSWEFGYLEIGGKELVCENVEFTDPIMVEGSNSKFINCSFVGYTDEGVDDGKAYSMTMYGVWAISGTQVYENCTFSGTRGLKVCDSNTSNSYASANVDITVDGCTFDNLSQKPGVAIDYSGDSDITFAVTIKNSDFINCQAGDQNLYIYETDNYVPVTENNHVEKYTGEVVLISTKEELLNFANDVNINGNNYSGRMVKLTANIDLAGIDWEPIGQTGGNGVATYFCGMFDGQGHTISNMTIDGNATYGAGEHYAAGFFGFIDAGEAFVRNVNFDKATVSGHHWTGVVAGYLTGKISGCTVTKATVSCTHANNDACGDKAGVIVGYVNSGIVTDNTVIDSTVTSGRDGGQVAGAAKTTQVYGNTINNVTVTAAGDCTGANIRNEEIGRLM